MKHWSNIHSSIIEANALSLFESNNTFSPVNEWQWWRPQKCLTLHLKMLPLQGPRPSGKDEQSQHHRVFCERSSSVRVIVPFESHLLRCDSSHKYRRPPLPLLFQWRGRCMTCPVGAAERRCSWAALIKSVLAKGRT